MNNRALYAVIAVIVILIIAGVVYSQSKQTSAPVETNNQTSNVNNSKEEATPQTPATSTNETQGTLSDATAMEDGEAKVYEIAFNGTAYTPNTLTIKNGDIVVFKNNSEKNFWPASAPHPQHTNYPEFDAKGALAPGKTFQFKFTKVGKWGFHDHLTPTAFGSITVE